MAKFSSQPKASIDFKPQAGMTILQLLVGVAVTGIVLVMSGVFFQNLKSTAISEASKKAARQSSEQFFNYIHRTLSHRTDSYLRNRGLRLSLCQKKLCRKLETRVIKRTKLGETIVPVIFHHKCLNSTLNPDQERLWHQSLNFQGLPCRNPCGQGKIPAIEMQENQRGRRRSVTFPKTKAMETHKAFGAFFCIPQIVPKSLALEINLVVPYGFYKKFKPLIRQRSYFLNAEKGDLQWMQPHPTPKKPK